MLDWQHFISLHEKFQKIVVIPSLVIHFLKKRYQVYSFCPHPFIANCAWNKVQPFKESCHLNKSRSNFLVGKCPGHLMWQLLSDSLPRGDAGRSPYVWPALKRFGVINYLCPGSKTESLWQSYTMSVHLASHNPDPVIGLVQHLYGPL